MNNDFIIRYEKDLEMQAKEKLIYEDFLKQGNTGGATGFLSVLGNRCFHLLLSGYSSGQDAQTLKLHGQEMFNSYLNSWAGDCYFDIEKSYEIAIIFDIPKEEFLEFYTLQKSLNYKDKYLDLLVRYFDEEHEVTTDKLKVNRAISPLVEVIALAEVDKEQAVLRLKKYLDKQWLNMQKEGLITNRQHLNPAKFRGYLSMESVALVKMLGLDDEVLKSSPYYPERLAQCQ